jgi:deoxyguanosine kinase
LDDREYSLFYKLFHQLNNQLIQPELVVYLHRPVEALLNNIRKRNRSFEQNIEAEYLSSISQAYLSYLNIQTNFPALILNLNESDFENNEAVYQKIKQHIFLPKNVNGVQQITI